MERNDLEQLVGDYLDGKLDAGQREAIAVRIAELLSPSAPGEFERIASSLRQLSKMAAPKHAVQRLLNRLSQNPDLVHGGANGRRKRPFGELLSAYVDGEIDQQRRKLIERRLRRSPAAEALMAEFRRTSAVLAALPVEPAPADTIAAAMQAIGAVECVAPVLEHAPSDGDHPFGPEFTGPRIEIRSQKNWTGWATAAFATAAAVLLLLAFHQVSTSGDRGNATTTTDAKSKSDKFTTSIAASATAGQPQPVAVENPLGNSAGNADAVAEAAGKDDVELPIEKLNRLRPGDVISLDEQQISFICLDVDEVYGTLRVVLSDNKVKVFADEKVAAKSPNDPKQLGMYVIEVSGTPEEIRSIIADLWHEEQKRHQIANVEIAKANPELLRRAKPPADQQVAKAPNDAAKQPEKVEQPIFFSSAKVEYVPMDVTAPTPLSPSRHSAAPAKRGKTVRSTDRGKAKPAVAIAEAKSTKAKTNNPEKTPAAVAAKESAANVNHSAVVAKKATAGQEKPRRVRVLFVLEPNMPDEPSSG